MGLLFGSLGGTHPPLPGSSCRMTDLPGLVEIRNRALDVALVAVKDAPNGGKL
jgi:hypothetical protein